MDSAFAEIKDTAEAAYEVVVSLERKEKRKEDACQIAAMNLHAFSLYLCTKAIVVLPKSITVDGEEVLLHRASVAANGFLVEFCYGKDIVNPSLPDMPWIQSVMTPQAEPIRLLALDRHPSVYNVWADPTLDPASAAREIIAAEKSTRAKWEEKKSALDELLGEATLASLATAEFKYWTTNTVAKLVQKIVPDIIVKDGRDYQLRLIYIAEDFLLGGFIYASGSKLLYTHETLAHTKAIRSDTQPLYDFFVNSPVYS